MASAADTVREQSNALQDAIRDRLSEAVEEVTTMASNLRSSALNLEDLPDEFEGELYRCRYGMNGSPVPTWRAEVDCGEGLVLFMNAMSGEVDPVIAATGRAVVRPDMLDGARVRVRRDPKEGRIVLTAILSELPREAEEADRPAGVVSPELARDADGAPIRVGDLVRAANDGGFGAMAQRRVLGVCDGFENQVPAKRLLALESGATGDGGYSLNGDVVYGIYGKDMRVVETAGRLPIYLLDSQAEPLFVGDRVTSFGNASERNAFADSYTATVLGVAKSRSDGGEFRVGTLVVLREGDRKGEGTYRTADGQQGRGVRAEYVTRV